jgi:hypothetical protein
VASTGHDSNQDKLLPAVAVGHPLPPPVLLLLLLLLLLPSSSNTAEWLIL